MHAAIRHTVVGALKLHIAVIAVAAVVAAVQATCADTNVNTATAEGFRCPAGQLLIPEAAQVFPPSENSCCTVSWLFYPVSLYLVLPSTFAGSALPCLWYCSRIPVHETAGTNQGEDCCCR
jgi:hypothetical protein